MPISTPYPENHKLGGVVTVPIPCTDQNGWPGKIIHNTVSFLLYFFNANISYYTLERVPKNMGDIEGGGLDDDLDTGDYGSPIKPNGSEAFYYDASLLTPGSVTLFRVILGGPDADSFRFSKKEDFLAFTDQTSADHQNIWCRKIRKGKPKVAIFYVVTGQPNPGRYVTDSLTIKCENVSGRVRILSIPVDPQIKNNG